MPARHSAPNFFLYYFCPTNHLAFLYIIMWYDYIAYLIIAAAVCCTARYIYRLLRHPEEASPCAGCTADCKLKGLKQSIKKGKPVNCTKKQDFLDK